MYGGSDGSANDGPSAGAGPTAGRTLVRWAFCKRVEVLEDALGRLASWA